MKNIFALCLVVTLSVVLPSLAKKKDCNPSCQQKLYYLQYAKNTFSNFALHTGTCGKRCAPTTGPICKVVVNSNCGDNVSITLKDCTCPAGSQCVANPNYCGTGDSSSSSGSSEACDFGQLNSVKQCTSITVYTCNLTPTTTTSTTTTTTTKPTTTTTPTTTTATTTTHAPPPDTTQWTVTNFPTATTPGQAFSEVFTLPG